MLFGTGLDIAYQQWKHVDVSYRRQSIKNTSTSAISLNFSSNFNNVYKKALLDDGFCILYIYNDGAACFVSLKVPGQEYVFKF